MSDSIALIVSGIKKQAQLLFSMSKEQHMLESLECKSGSCFSTQKVNSYVYCETTELQVENQYFMSFVTSHVSFCLHSTLSCHLIWPSLGFTHTYTCLHIYIIGKVAFEREHEVFSSGLEPPPHLILYSQVLLFPEDS